MATDYKKLLINYSDKILFVGFLILFLVVAFKVVMSGPPGGTTVPQMPKPPSGPPPELLKELYVLNRFTNPEEPDAAHDFTSDPEKIEPGPTEKQCPICGWIVPRSVATCPKCRYNWAAGDIVPEKDDKKDTPPPPLVEGVPFRVLSIARIPVDIYFMGFIRNPWRNNEIDLQINWGKGTKTSIVPLGETFHGYRLYPLERKVEMVNRPGLPAGEEERVFLTITKAGEEPFVVESRKTVQERELVATLDPAEGRWRTTHRDVRTEAEGAFDVYADYIVDEIGGKRRQYRVLEVTEIQVVVYDQKEQKRHELKKSIPAPKPPPS